MKSGLLIRLNFSDAQSRPIYGYAMVSVGCRLFQQNRASVDIQARGDTYAVSAIHTPNVASERMVLRRIVASDSAT